MPPEPKLHSTKKTLSNQLPDTPGHYDLNECYTKRWIASIYKKKIDKDLLESGRSKSSIKLTVIDMTKEFCREIVNMELETAIQIEIDREDKRVIAQFDEKFLKDKVDNIYQLIGKSLEKDRSLYPIFMSSKIRNLVTGNEDLENSCVNFKPNLFLNQLCNEGSPNRFLIFLLIEGGVCGKRVKFRKNIEFYLKCRKYEIEDIKRKLKIDECENPIVPVFLPERELGIGRKRKIMMLIAEYFEMQRFYLIDDDIELLSQYDEVSRQRRTSESVPFRALDYMTRVLEYGIYGKDLEKNASLALFQDTPGEFSRLVSDWRMDLTEATFTDKSVMRKKEENPQVFEKLKTFMGDLTQNGNIVEKDCLLLIHLLKQIVGENDLCKKVYGKLIGSRSKVIGQVSMNDQDHYTLKGPYNQRLQGSDKSTHCISSVRYQLVLYNLDAIRGIHPVCDDALFELPLENRERIDLCRDAKNKDLLRKDVSAWKAAYSGYKYSDKAHVFYQILNGVSGYSMYYFSFKPMRVPSKVDADEVDSNIDSSINIKLED
jgi:hypothetical protein